MTLSMTPMRILIVEDDLLIAKMLEATLVSLGHNIIGKAGNLSGGLYFADTAEIDVAIVDLNLNGVSSQVLIKRLLDLGIPCLLLSGYSASQLPDWAVDIRFLTKPFEVDRVVSAITELVKEKQIDGIRPAT